MGQETIQVLLIEDDQGYADLIHRMLDTAVNVSFEVHHADSLQRGLERLQAGGVDVVLLDLRLPDSSGVQTVSRVHAKAPNVPIIVLTGTDSPQMVLETIKVGVKEYFVKSRVEAEQLVKAIFRSAETKRLFSALPARSRRIGKTVHVLLVEDNPGDVELIRRMLAAIQTVHFKVVGARKLSSALKELGQRPDLVLLDLNLPDSAGLDTLRRLRAQESLVPIIIVTGAEDQQQALEALANGAQDYLVKGKVDSRLLGLAILRHVKTSASERT